MASLLDSAAGFGPPVACWPRSAFRASVRALLRHEVALGTAWLDLVVAKPCVSPQDSTEACA